MLLVLILTALLTSAAFAETKSDYDRNFDFSKLRTWDFKIATRMPNDPLLTNDLWDRRVRDGLVSHFAEVRFAKVNDGEPTFLVNYFMGLEKKYDTRYLDYGFPGWYGRTYGYGRWFGWDAPYGGGPYGHVDVWSVPYTESTLIVDVIDSRTNHLVWRGYDVRTIDFEKSEKTIHKSVENLTKRLRRNVDTQLKKIR
jgi:hypothetical protein